MAVKQLLVAQVCTTNCLAPMAQVLDDKFGIVNGYDDDHSCVYQ